MYLFFVHKSSSEVKGYLCKLYLYPLKLNCTFNCDIYRIIFNITMHDVANK